MLRRVAGEAGAVETPIGHLPRTGDLNISGLEIDPGDLEELLRVDVAGWKAEMESIGDYLGEYGSRAPSALHAEQQKIAAELG
jgi:phosphoenolpyruvate carboxykinase (GTP)